MQNAEWLVGGGELGALIRATDWSQTAFGPRDSWPPHLRTVVSLLVESAFPKALLWGRELLLLYNDAYRVIARDRHPRALGRSSREVWPEVWHINEPIFTAVLDRGQTIHLDDQLFPIDRDGRREDAFFTLSYSPVRGQEGRIDGCLVTLIETTQRVRERDQLRLQRDQAAAQAKRERERARAARARQLRLFEAVASTTPDFVYVFDRQGRFQYANRRLLEVWGMQLPDVVGKTCRELGYEQWHHDMHMREIAQVIETRQPIKGEVPFRAPRTGHFGVYEYIFTPVFGPDGAVEAVAGTTRDVTDRKQAEEGLRRRDLQFQLLIENVGSGVALVDGAGQFTLFNREFLDLFGLDPLSDVHNVRSQQWSAWEVLDELEKPLAVDEHPVRKAAITGRAVHGQLVGVRRPSDGRLVWMLVSAVPVLDDRGALEHLICTYHDVTEVKRVAAELREANAMLRDADRRKNEFLAVLSHELRNPLGPIHNSLYILDRAAPGGPQAQRALQVIDRQARHLHRLVDDLLEVTRITQGKIRLNREILDLGALVRRCADDYRGAFADAGVALDVETDADVRVNADPVRLAQVVGNLLSNAAKFTPRGGRTSISTALVGSDAVIRVRDTGVGIHPEVLNKLFVPFVQAESTLDRTRGGLGLGLAVLRGMVELHGGAVTAHSEGPGGGAEFTVTLPAAPVPEERRRSPRAVNVEASRRIVVIEDNRDAAETLKTLLELEGHVVSVAYDGREGVDVVKATQPDVVLCDIGLPGINGFEVARVLRADPALACTRLVALSGYALPGDVEQAREAGFHRHLAKPIDRSVLVAICSGI